jgi:hypothetical protein
MMMSFLDLLLSALGGVALLVMIFASIQTKNAKAADSLDGRHVLVRVPDGSGLFVGREIGVYVKTDAEGPLHLFDTGASGLRANWPETPRRDYAFSVFSRPGAPVRIGVWLRMPGPDAVDVNAYLGAIGSGVPVSVSWLEDRDEDPQPKRLDAASHFLAEVELP